MERKSKDCSFLSTFRKTGDTISKNTRFLVKTWKSFFILLFLSCGESPLPLNVNTGATKFVYYSCAINRPNYICGIWSYHDGKVWDVIITDKGLKEYPI